MKTLLKIITILLVLSVASLVFSMVLAIWVNGALFGIIHFPEKLALSSLVLVLALFVSGMICDYLINKE